MNIEPVSNNSDLQDFINLPYRLYRADRTWIAPLRSEQRAQYAPQRNPMLTHCEFQLFLARQVGEVIGRISSFIDHLALEHWGLPIGLFGSFECVNDPQVSGGLLASAREWLRGKRMRLMRGPWSFASQEWGLVVEGYEPEPVIMAPYNPPYYNDLLADFGLVGVKDLLVYVIDAREHYTIPERILQLTDKVQQRYRVHVRPVNMQRLEEDVLTITRLANASLCDNWGFYPVTDEEARAMARDMKQIVNPTALLIAEEENGNPIGFAMSLPDINQVLKGLNGRLLPFGFLKLLFMLPRLHQYRMWALGVIPEWQGKAIDTLVYRATYDAGFSE